MPSKGPVIMAKRKRDDAGTTGKPEKRKRRKIRARKLELRNSRPSDYADIREIMDRVYSDMGGAWTRDELAAQIRRFPAGQICIEDDGRVVAAAVSVIVDYDRYGDHHTYEQITGNGLLTTHDPKGDTLYGVDLFVHPDYRGLRLGRRLYDARKELCENLNLRRIIVAGRIPGYHEQREDGMSPQLYVQRVRSKELYDPVLGFQFANDFHVRRIITGYLPEDQESETCAVLLEWINIYFQDKPVLIGEAKTTVRVGALQWQMRPTDSLEALFQRVEYFVDVVAGYNADFVLFPEYFNAPLMAGFARQHDADAVRSLAGVTGEIRDRMVELAVKYNINIIAGGMLEYKRRRLRSVSYLCRRDGTWDAQYKLHVTPDEAQLWGLRGSDRLEVFDTDVGRIGILVCFDVEFPELARLLAERGVTILFVPYWTDTKHGYLRIRHCAQARAIENECYVVISGSVGNIPDVPNMDIQYSQSAVFTPSDLAFPHDAVAAESTPNTETTLIVDLDLELLKELRLQGSVRNLADRRLDLYRVTWLDDAEAE